MYLSLLDLYNWLFITFVFLYEWEEEIRQFLKFLLGTMNLDNVFHSEHCYCLHLQERWLQYFFALRRTIGTTYLEE
jgi:hypothetical protein